MLLVGIGVLSRLFRHDLAGRVATLNLTGGAVGSASSSGVTAASSGPIQGPPAPGAPVTAHTKNGISAPLAARGKIIGTPGVGTHNGAPPFDNWQSSNAIDIGVRDSLRAVPLLTGGTLVALLLLSRLIARGTARRPVAVTLRGAA